MSQLDHSPMSYEDVWLFLVIFSGFWEEKKGVFLQRNKVINAVRREVKAVQLLFFIFFKRGGGGWEMGPKGDGGGEWILL